jgi:competence protein ComGC
MKKNLLILSAFILLVFAPNIFAQKAERISIGRGAKQSVITGNLSSYKSKKVFIIKLRKGQTLKTEQLKSDSSAHYVTVFVKAPNGKEINDSDASCNNRKIVTPTKAGDYRIEVVECMKADAWRGSFKLKVRVE